MERKTIYFDNAATSYPKPEAVYAAQDAYLRAAGNPGRGAHLLSMQCARTIFESRLATAEFLGVADASRLIFTPGCTQSINMVLKGLSLQPGDAVLVTALEHNAVMRPLRQLEISAGIKVQVLPYAHAGIVTKSDLEAAIADCKPRLCMFTAASNVTGELLDLEVIAAVCGKHKVLLAVDAAQTAGSQQAVCAIDGIDFWCASTHKGLMGAPGLGLLYISEKQDLQPLVAGGTGSGSEHLEMPVSYPDHLEAGTANGPGIATLRAAVEFIAAVGVTNISKHEMDLLHSFLDWCEQEKRVKVFGNTFQSDLSDQSNAPAGAERRMPVASFRIDGIGADRIADILDREYNIAVRAGLHCAAQAHESLGTTASGLVRVSFGFFNTMAEVEELTTALSAILRSAAV